jgi:hypothetical protein
MPASRRKQLNVRSDEAYATAHELAERLGATTTEIVVAALREYKSRRRIPSRLVTPEEAEANYRAIMRGVAETRRRAPPSESWTADDLYDERGVPK